MGTQRYTEEFRSSAVQMVIEKHMSPAKVAAELGVTAHSVREWVKQHENGQRTEYVQIQELERELKRLKKELAESKEAVEILKKTAAILSKP